MSLCRYQCIIIITCPTIYIANVTMVPTKVDVITSDIIRLPHHNIYILIDVIISFLFPIGVIFRD